MRGVRRSHTPLLPPIKGVTDRGRTGVALGLTRPQPWWPATAPAILRCDLQHPSSAPSSPSAIFSAHSSAKSPEDPAG